MRPAQVALEVRIVAAIVLLIALLRPAESTPAGATCTPDIGPGIPPPAATPAKLPGFHIMLGISEVLSHLEKSAADGRVTEDDGYFRLA